MKATWRIPLFTYLAFAVYFVVDELLFRILRASIDGVVGQRGVAHILAYCIVGIPLVLSLRFMFGRWDVVSRLGLNRSIGRGFGFALLCTLPMLVGYAFVFEWNSDLQLNTLLISVLAAAFFEELYFRAFLFGVVFRYSRFGFIPAVILGALLFAIVHLYQSSDPATLAGIFITTLLGGLLFAWVYAEWDFNIWVPIGLHLFMNLFWELFDVSDNALGSTYANIFRLASIALVIVLTAVYKRRDGGRLAVNRETVWMKKE